MSSSEDKCEVSKDKHEDRKKIEYFREAINSTEGRKGKSKPRLGGLSFILDFPPITEIDGVNFGSHNRACLSPVNRFSKD